VTAGSELKAASLKLLARVRREIADFTGTALHYRQALTVLETAPVTVGNDRRVVPVLLVSERLSAYSGASPRQNSITGERFTWRVQPSDAAVVAALISWSRPNAPSNVRDLEIPDSARLQPGHVGMVSVFLATR
jgi:hypothetical protein